MLNNLKKSSASEPKPLLLIIFLLLVLSQTYGQIDIQRYTTATDTFYWKRYIRVPKPPEVNLRRFLVSHASQVYDSFLAGNISQIPQFNSDSTHRFTNKELRKQLFAVEINGDNRPDMIFQGTSEEGLAITRIWINEKEGFTLVFEDYQYISQFQKEGDRLVRLQLGDVGNSGDYLYFTRDYMVHYNNDEVVFVKGKQSVIYKNCEEPSVLYPQPVPFTAVSDTMMLRASAALQNEPFLPDMGSFGNIVAKYRSKARGVVLAQKSYGKGNVWYYVEISPAVSPAASILYGTDRIPTFVSGWVSALSIQMDPK